MKHARIGALIAAAGKSERMGLDKALLPIMGRSLLAFSAKNMSRIKPYRIYATLPAYLLLHENLRREISLFDVLALVNRYPELGYAGSIKTVLEENEETPLDGLLITPVDSPIDDENLVILISRLAHFFEQLPVIIVPFFRMLPGHPVYISKHFFQTFLNDETTSVRALSFTHKQFVKALFWPHKTVLANLNYAHEFLDFVARSAYLNPSLRMGDEASNDAPM